MAFSASNQEYPALLLISLNGRSVADPDGSVFVVHEDSIVMPKMIIINDRIVAFMVFSYLVLLKSMIFSVSINAGFAPTAFFAMASNQTCCFWRKSWSFCVLPAVKSIEEFPRHSKPNENLDSMMHQGYSIMPFH